MLHEYSSSTFASLPWRIRPMAQGVATANPLGHPATRSVTESTLDGAPASRLLRLEQNGPRPRPSRFLTVVALLAATATLGGCGDNTALGAGQPGTGASPMRGGPSGMMGPGMRGYGMMMGSSMQRHRQVMMTGLPETYRSLRNPLSADTQVISQGKALYRADCASCHGSTGEGNGPAAAGMSPPPANLRWLMSRPIASDGYLMWAISEGGAGLGTAMPAFKDALDENNRWKIIRYLRTLR